jgi:deoxyribodipyrimidine photolyase-related protein
MASGPGSVDSVRTVWVFGDQLNRRIGALGAADPDDTMVLLVESDRLIRSGRHRQRVHLVITAMRRFAAELEGSGFRVDLRRAPTLASGVEHHRAAHRPGHIVATEPNSRAARALCEQLGVELMRSDQFLCHYDEFAAWADGNRMRLEDFYRWNRTRLGYLMDGDVPAEGRWNWDEVNREPPPHDLSVFPPPPLSPLDDLDRHVLAELPGGLRGAEPAGLWATGRRAALGRLQHFVDELLPRFGPYEDAMATGSWHLAHSLLSPYLNLGLLLPGEVCERVEEAYRAGRVPIQSAEGFIRQVVGWREYVWGLYWLWPDHIDQNTLGHRRPIPPMMRGEARTDMRCVQTVLDRLDERAYLHHIERLMVLSNFANLYGIEPRAVMQWMWDSYIDGAEWVMVPNVMGMGLWADGGRMATKPYVSGGAYINRMSDFCFGCRFDPRKRTGDDACPFTTLYWDFLARHEETLAGNHRLSRNLAAMRRLTDLDAVRTRAAEVADAIAGGAL